MDSGPLMKRWRTLHQTRIGKALLGVAAFFLVMGLLLFTPWGNRLFTPLIEKLLVSQLSTGVAVDRFTLRHDRFELTFHDPHRNTVSLQGGFSLLTLRMYAHYRLLAPGPGGFNPLQIPFTAQGALSGGFGLFTVRGNAHLLGGAVLYRIQLRRFKFADLQLALSDIAYEPLMHRLDYPSSTDTRLFGTINLNGFDRRDISGTVELSSKTGRFTPTDIVEENEPFDFRSLLADEHGRVKPFDLNVTAAVSLEHAGILEQFAGFPLGGAIDANATLEGDNHLLRGTLRTSLARSDTTLRVTIPELDPTQVSLTAAHADLSGLFRLFALTPPLTGRCDASGEINGSKALLNLRLVDARTVPSVLKKEYRITQPPIRFTATISADISRDEGARYRGSFDSDLGRLEFDRNTTHEQMLRDLLHSLR